MRSRRSQDLSVDEDNNDDQEQPPPGMIRLHGAMSVNDKAFKKGDLIASKQIYPFFLIVVSLRYAWRAWNTLRRGAESDLHHYEELGKP